MNDMNPISPTPGTMPPAPSTAPRLPHAHLVQLDIAWEDKAANYAGVEKLLAAAAVHPGDFILLPEMFDTGFSFNLDITADRDLSTFRLLKRLAQETRCTVQGARSVLGPDGRGRNRATVAAPDGSIICEYDKIHPFTFGRETEHFSGGSEVLTFAWNTGGAGPSSNVSVCPAICYDLRFPELFRIGMLKGAGVFALGANWPAPRKLHRHALSIARAIENQAYFLSVNRAGRDPTLEYAGGSIAVSPKGDILGELSAEAGVLSVPIDLVALADWRRTFPAWRDHRLIGRTS